MDYAKIKNIVSRYYSYLYSLLLELSGFETLLISYSNSQMNMNASQRL